MKNLKRNLVPRIFVPVCSALILLFTIASCSKEADNIVTANEEEETAHITELKQFVAGTTGMPLSSVVYSKTQNQFIVDGDQLFDVADIELRFNAENTGDSIGRTQQRRNIYVVSRANAVNITVYADNTVPSVWLTALDAAIANWNSANCLIRVSRINTNTANITVKTNYSVSSTVASANSPDVYGNPGKYITINTYKNSLESAKKTFALTHEMGHAFGFTHTNGTYGSLIAGTPVSDNASIMYSYVLNWVGFSSYDRVAFSTVYPL